MSVDFPFPVISVPGDRAEAELLRLRQSCAKTGSVPIIIGDEDNALLLAENLEDLWDKDAEFSLARALVLDHWFAERLTEEDYALDDSQYVVYPGGSSSMTSLTIGYDHRNQPLPEVFIAILPTGDSTEIPVHLHFGGWNSCPQPHVHMALARYWGERYGAVIATISSNVVEFTAERPPADDAQALELAWQQYLYCGDIVSQGVGSVATLARALRYSSRWYFWWD